MDNHSYDLYVLTQTPLHVGGEQEKHLEKDFDYFEQERLPESTFVWKTDEESIIQAIGVSDYVDALEKGKRKFREVLRQRGLTSYEQYCLKLGEIEGVSQQLHSMIAEGRTGMPYLPGTSLKGALRSTLFKAAGGSNRERDRDIFGEFSNSALRFLQVGDVYFNHPGRLYNSRVYNPHQYPNTGWEGGWKTELRSGSNEPSFKDSGFATALQTVPPQSLGKLRLKISAAELERYQDFAIKERSKVDRGRARGYAKPIPEKAADLLVAKAPLNKLFSTIHNYTHTYLEREIAYFTELKGGCSDLIIERLNRLRTANQPHSPLLRVGYGAGFHAVTGDYQYQDHLEPLKKMEHRKLRKSRRLAFDWDEQNEQYRFWPLGFVQLLTAQDAEPHLGKLREAPEPATKRLENITKESGPVTETGRPVPPPQPAPPAAPTLVSYPEKRLKKGVEIDGEVVGQAGSQMIIKPYLSGYEDSTVELRFPAGMPAGTIVSMTVRLEGKTLKAQGFPKKK